MAKRKKTRRQKIQADERKLHKVESAPVVGQTNHIATPQFSLENTSQIKTVTKVISTPVAINPLARNIATHDYRYLSFDLLKTFILTCSIIVAEILLRFLTKGA